MPSFASKAASEEPTLSPFVISSTGVIISTILLLILVGMLRTWKKRGLTRVESDVLQEGQQHQLEQPNQHEQVLQHSTWDISTDLLQITLGENQPHIAHKKGNEAEEGTVVDLVRMDPLERFVRTVFESISSTSPSSTLPRITANAKEIR